MIRRFRPRRPAVYSVGSPEVTLRLECFIYSVEVMERPGSVAALDVWAEKTRLETGGHQGGMSVLKLSKQNGDNSFQLESDILNFLAA